jgi:hypothetical protein
MYEKGGEGRRREERGERGDVSPTCACASMAGFQSLSKKITESAPVRLIPRPPLLVERMKQNSLSSELNLSISFCRRSMPVEPSNLT